MHQVSLLHQQTIASLSPNDPLFHQYSIVVSPSQRYIALLSQSDITIIDTADRNITLQLKMQLKWVLFDHLNDTFAFAASKTSLVKISVRQRDGAVEAIINSKEQNQLGPLTYSPDHKLIYYTNRSKLQAYSPTASAIHLIDHFQSCPADAYFIDPSSQLLITSSYDCKLCAYSIQTNIPGLIAATSIQLCRIGTIAFGSGYAFLTQDSITTRTPQLITLSLPNLTIISYTNQSSSDFSLNLVKINNYILSYAPMDQDVWIYKDSISKAQRVTLPLPILAMSPGRQGQEVYILANVNDSSLSITTYTLAFNCSNISGTINKTQSFSLTCICTQGRLFDSSRISCSRSQCLNTEASPCKCPYQQMFDPFSLNCHLDCSQVYNTYSNRSFGNPARCSCNYPFQWNPELSDCTYLDCSLLPNTLPTNFTQRCNCINTFIWDDASVSCKQQISNSTMIASDSGSSPAGLIIAIIFLVLLIILSGIIFYVKKYRKSEEDIPKPYEFKYEQHNPTPRPIAFENQARTDTQLSAPSDRKSERDGLHTG